MKISKTTGAIVVTFVLQYLKKENGELHLHDLMTILFDCDKLYRHVGKSHLAFI